MQFVRQLIVLLSHQVDVSVECLNLALLCIRLFDQLGIVIFDNVELVLKTLNFACTGLLAHFSIALVDLKFLGAANFVLVGFDELRLCLLMTSILLLVVANFIVKLL